jgi:hypothetical protein
MRGYATVGIAKGAMPDLPELPADKKNELAARWDLQLLANGFTEDKIAYFDWELNQVSRLDWRPGRPFGSFQEWMRFQTEKTVTKSVQLADAWFQAHISEYWPLFRSISADLRKEEYERWLAILKEQAIYQIASLCKGRSELTDQWFEGVCRPAVTKALDTIAERAIGVLIGLRLKRAVAAPMNRLVPPPESPSANEIEAALASDKSGPPVAREYKTALGRNIDRLRINSGWSFDKLAEKTGLDKGLILGHVRKGKGAHPDTVGVYAQAFSKALGREITALSLSE